MSSRSTRTPSSARTISRGSAPVLQWTSCEHIRSRSSAVSCMRTHSTSHQTISSRSVADVASSSRFHSAVFVESLTISELRRCLRDLFAVATLPAVWAGADARKIAQTLGDALARALDADVVYVLVDEVVEGHLDVRLPDAGEHARGDAQRFLRGLITAGPGSCTCELFGVALNAFVDMIDLRAKQGGVVVAARRADFPSPTERALLRVAVNQASVALETVGYVAELQRIAKTKEALVAELENGSRRKDEFLAMLGHELRNPLAAIHAAHEQRIAAQDAGRPDQIIGTQLTTLRRLVDDLLDVSRIATGKLVLSDDIVDVRAAVSRALVACEHAATQKGIALS